MLSCFNLETIELYTELLNKKRIKLLTISHILDLWCNITLNITDIN